MLTQSDFAYAQNLSLRNRFISDPCVLHVASPWTWTTEPIPRSSCRISHMQPEQLKRTLVRSCQPIDQFSAQTNFYGKAQLRATRHGCTIRPHLTRSSFASIMRLRRDRRDKRRRYTGYPILTQWALKLWSLFAPQSPCAITNFVSLVRLLVDAMIKNSRILADFRLCRFCVGK